MSPSRGAGEAAAAAGGAGGAEADGGPLGASTSAAATVEAGMPAAADPPRGWGRGRARWWLRWLVGVAVLAVVAVVLALGLSLRGGGGASGRSSSSSSRSQAGPGPGGTGGGWQSQQADETPVGVESAKQQQQPPSSGVATANATVTPKPTAGVAGQGQAAAAASTLNELAKQLLGEGGGNPGLGGGLLENEEEDEAEATFIAVEGCTPHNGGELHFLVERSTCPVITLVPAIFYNLTEYIVVRRPVLIVGRPLNPPTIDAHAAYRAFLVEAGGVLDLRHVVIYRGKPIEVIKPQLYYEVRGAVAYIRNGGTAFFTDCVMLLHEDTVSEFLITPTPQTTVRMIGGFLLLESGTLHVVGCHILVQRPGVLFREVYTVGGFILVVDGTLLLTGSTLTASFLFITVLGLGNFVCVLGGNAIITGVVFTLNGGFVAGNGAGLLQFIGGGVATFTGSVSEGNLLFLSFFGAGMGQFTGGGVSILTGMIFSSISVMNYGAGVGFNNGLGAGVMVKTGVTQSGAHSQSALAVLGVATFVGAGTVVYAETAWNRNTALAAFYGGGGSLYLGTGVATIVNSVSAGATATVIAAAAGGDHTLFAGWMNLINSWFFKWVVIAAYYGQGVDTCLVAGGAYLLNTGFSGIPPIVDANRGLYNIYVAGHGVALNDSRAGVVATHKVYRVNNGTSKRRRQLASPVSLRALNLTGGAGATLRLPTGPARLEMRRVSFRDLTPEAFKQAIQESARDGVPNQWPWRLKARLQEEEAAERRERRRRRAQEEAKAVVSPPLDQQPQQQEQVALGEDEPLVPLYPGSPVLVPYAAPRPVEGPGANSRVYVASPLAGCRACGVRASSGSAAATTTGEAFAGKGAEGCEFSEACAAGAEKAEDEDDDGYNSEVMWMVPPGSGRMPNTSLAVVDLVVSSPATSTADPAPQQVLRALNRTIASMSLGPPRFHLRVLPASVPLPYDPPAEGGRLRRLLEEQQAQEQAAAAAVDPGEPCSRRAPFRAYLVSDKPQVIAALAKGLRQAAAAAAMTKALQEEQTAQGALGACGLRATRAVQTFIPGLNSSALLQPPKGATAGGPTAAVPTAGTGSGIARVLAAAGKARPIRTVLFGDEDNKEEGMGGSRALAAAPAAEAPRHPTAALLLHGKVDEGEDGSRVVKARPRETYTLALGRFPSGRRLRVRLVSQTGRGALLHVLPSEPQGAEGRQGWAWTVPSLEPGKYFLEVASHARDGFAYTQAFDVLAAAA